MADYSAGWPADDALSEGTARPQPTRPQHAVGLLASNVLSAKGRRTPRSAIRLGGSRLQVGEACTVAHRPPQRPNSHNLPHQHAAPPQQQAQVQQTRTQQRASSQLPMPSRLPAFSGLRKKSDIDTDRASLIERGVVRSDQTIQRDQAEEQAIKVATKDAQPTICNRAVQTITTLVESRAVTAACFGSICALSLGSEQYALVFVLSAGGVLFNSWAQVVGNRVDRFLHVAHTHPLYFISIILGLCLVLGTLIVFAHGIKRQVSALWRRATQCRPGAHSGEDELEDGANLHQQLNELQQLQVQVKLEGGNKDSEEGLEKRLSAVREKLAANGGLANSAATATWMVHFGHHAKRITLGLLTIGLFFADVISDVVRVCIMFFATQNRVWGSEAALLLGGQYVMVYWRVSTYLLSAFGDGSAMYRWFRWVGLPFGVVALDVLMLLEPIGLLRLRVLPLPEGAQIRTQSRASHSPNPVPHTDTLTH